MRTPLLISLVLLVSCQPQIKHTAEHKLSYRQERLSKFIDKYQNDIESAPDSLSRQNIYADMWNKHMYFIQDTLGFKSFPPPAILDTFYFEKVTVIQSTANQRKYLAVFLSNKHYYTVCSYDVTNNPDLQAIPLYSMLVKLNQNIPVLAVLSLEDLFLRDSDILTGSKKISLSINLESIQNSE